LFVSDYMTFNQPKTTAIYRPESSYHVSLPPFNLEVILQARTEADHVINILT
jgi:hypothetical protein